jgi:hypothetical protein
MARRSSGSGDHSQGSWPNSRLLRYQLTGSSISFPSFVRCSTCARGCLTDDEVDLLLIDISSLPPILFQRRWRNFPLRSIIS